MKLNAYLIMAAVAVFLCLTFVCYSQHQDIKTLKSEKAALKLENQGWKTYAGITKTQAETGLVVEQGKVESFNESQKRIAELEAALQSDSCAGIRVPVNAARRLHDRASGLYKPAAASGKSNR